MVISRLRRCPASQRQSVGESAGAPPGHSARVDCQYPAPATLPLAVPHPTPHTLTALLRTCMPWASEGSYGGSKTRFLRLQRCRFVVLHSKEVTRVLGAAPEKGVQKIDAHSSVATSRVDLKDNPAGVAVGCTRLCNHQPRALK